MKQHARISRHLFLVNNNDEISEVRRLKLKKKAL